MFIHNGTIYINSLISITIGKHIIIIQDLYEITKRRISLLFGTHGAMTRGHKYFTLVWRCHQLLSEFSGTCTRVSRQLRLIIRVIMRWIRGLCTGILALLLKKKLRKTSTRRPSYEGSAISHRLKLGSLTSKSDPE